MMTEQISSFLNSFLKRDNVPLAVWNCFYRRTNHHHRERERGNDDIKLNCLLSNESTLILTFIVCCVPCQEQSTYLINFFSLFSLFTISPPFFFFNSCDDKHTDLSWIKMTAVHHHSEKELIFFNLIQQDRVLMVLNPCILEKGISLQ